MERVREPQTKGPIEAPCHVGLCGLVSGQAQRKDIHHFLLRMDLYAILHLPRDASVQDVKTSFRKLALVHHPDRYS